MTVIHGLIVAGGILLIAGGVVVTAVVIGQRAKADGALQQIIDGVRYDMPKEFREHVMPTVAKWVEELKGKMKMR
jgi:hypothetical protein